MNDRDALHAAVLDRPDDDTPRLALADWYDDHGDAARAEFIRIGIETARTTAHCYHDLTQPPDCPVCALHLRAADLARMPVPTADRTDHRCAWEAWAGLPGFACLNLMGDRSADGIDSRLRERGRPPGRYFRFGRGFVDEVRLPLAAFVGHPYHESTGSRPGLVRELFAAHPITRVVLTDVEPWTTGAANVTDGDPEHGWSWWRASAWLPGRTADDRGYLPDDLFDMMARMYPGRVLIDGGPPSNQHVGFPSAAAALDALSAACVAYARREAAKPAPA